MVNIIGIAAAEVVTASKQSFKTIFGQVKQCKVIVNSLNDEVKELIKLGISFSNTNYETVPDVLIQFARESSGALTSTTNTRKFCDEVRIRLGKIQSFLQELRNIYIGCEKSQILEALEFITSINAFTASMQSNWSSSCNSQGVKECKQLLCSTGMQELLKQCTVRRFVLAWMKFTTSRVFRWIKCTTSRVFRRNGDQTSSQQQ
jgi:hypothetical protein